MAMSKKTLFENNENDLGNLCKALSHPARVRIIKLLLKKNDQTCQQIVDQLPLSQSTVSQHLSELRKYNLLKGKNVKTSMVYSLEKDQLSRIQKLINEVFYNPLISQVKQASLF